jgi:hypothetical protein
MATSFGASMYPRCAPRYDRLTGYFSARALALAARGVEGLVVNNGRMRLIVGCTLGEEEVAAIERGESLRVAVERTLLKLPPLSADPRAIDSLELLAWMVANGFMDVKVAVPCDLDRHLDALNILSRTLTMAIDTRLTELEEVIEQQAESEAFAA